MPKKSSPKSLTARLLRIGHANLAIVATFILVFVGLGTWFVARSEASGCTSQTFSTATPGGYGNVCVKAIQSMLDHFNIGTPLKVCNNGAISRTCVGYYDGIYGYKTASDVRTFQSESPWQQGYPRLTVDGKVGLNTWTQLCLVASGRDNNDYYRAGCSSLFGGYGPY